MTDERDRVKCNNDPPIFDFVAHLYRQRAFSEKTFGPGVRTAGLVEHIRRELKEIEAKPHDLSEWMDVAILAYDGAWRAGYTPEQIIMALVSKQSKNESRKWPDWRTAPADGPIEHDRSADVDVSTSIPSVEKEPWKCKARASTTDPPQDCDWPTCGCDPYADKVVDALLEAGALKSARDV